MPAIYTPTVSPTHRLRVHYPIPDPDDEHTCMCGLVIDCPNDRHIHGPYGRPDPTDTPTGSR